MTSPKLLTFFGMNASIIVNNLLEASGAKIESITTEDMPHIQTGVEQAFGHYGDWVWPYTLKATDWSISVKAVLNERVAGFYCLSFRDINDAVKQYQLTPLENLSTYRSKKGLEGIVLFVLPELRNLGIGSELKNATRNMGADYVWGIQLKSLGNLEQWLRRRRLVAENEWMHLTLEDL